jgi:predicted enzyme related to lactoylglutathione lyase
MFKDAKFFSSFSVNNIHEAKKFYTNILGLEVEDFMEGMLSINIKGGNRIFVYSKDNHTPATFTILNFPVDDIEQAIEALKKHHVHFEHYDHQDYKTDEKGICRWDSTKMAWFKDPAGNILSLIEEE